MATYSLNASLCPPLVTPAALLVPGTDTAPVTETPAVGDTTAVPAIIDRLAVHVDLGARRGGGAYAVTEGLDPTAAALVCTVSAGQALIDGPATLAAAATVALADNAYNWIWLLQDGTLTKTSDAGTTPPAAPSAAGAFLGRIQVTAGSPGTPDYSGRWELRNGTLWRRTGDAAAPNDTPAATLLFVTVTAGGTYLWTGLAYLKLGAVAAAVADSAGAPSAGYVQAEAAAVLAELRALKTSLEAAGLLTP